MLPLAEYPGNQFNGPLTMPPPLPHHRGIRCLPLREISVDVEVQECISRTTLVQSFWNPSDTPIDNASYQFPMARGTVLESLRCVIDNEVTMEGQIKARGEARAAFKEAVRQHLPATLMEATPKEMVELSLANIRPQTTVKVEIVYLSRLRYEAGKGTILVVPRYIAPPASSTTLSNTGPTREVNLVVKVHLSALVPIAKVQSKYHPISVQIGSTDIAQETSSFKEPDPTKAIVAFEGTKTNLMKDFVLIIETSKDPLAIMGNCSEGDVGEAIILEFSSDQLFSETPTELHPTEYVLVIDVPCASMIQGLPLDAISVFLQKVPYGSLLNIYTAYGNDNSQRYRSGLYSVADLDHVMQQAHRVYHNTRSTDLVRTLGKAVDQRNRSSTAHVIILTVCDQNQTLQGAIDFIESNTIKTERHVHFSVIGFGDGLPSHIKTKLEHLSHGRVELLSEANRVEAAVANIIEAVLPWKLEICVDDIPQPNYHSLARALQLSARDNDDLVQNAISQYEQMMYTQTPHRLDLLQQSARYSILLLSHEKKYERRPSNITVKATAISGDILSLKIPITTSSMNPGSIHRLAAKAVIDDLEGDRSFLHEVLGPSIFLNKRLQEEIERNVERIGTDLGLRWSIIGRWTSFVAVDHSEPSQVAHNIYKCIHYSTQIPHDSKFTGHTMRGAPRGQMRPHPLADLINAPMAHQRTPTVSASSTEDDSSARDSEDSYSSSSERMPQGNFGIMSHSQHRRSGLIQPQNLVARLKVTSAETNDNSCIEFSCKAREEFGIRPNDIVLVRWGRQRIAAKRVTSNASEDQEAEGVGLSEAARQNAGLELGQMVNIYRWTDAPDVSLISFVS